MSRVETSSSRRTERNNAVPDRATHRLLLYGTVTLTGGAVMVLELLGTRIIGPFYGVSLYVWASLIAVTMIALALGYFIGGYAADRFPSVRLSHVLLAAALGTAVIPLLTGPVLRLTDSLGLRGGAFTSALLLFTFPLTALAMVGPYVIKRATRDLAGVGTVAGSVYAVSTVGSVAGTLLLGFYLLPLFGTKTILLSVSLLLASLSAVVSWQERARTAALAPTAMAVFAAFGLWSATGFAGSGKSLEGFAVLSEAESLYGWVRVVDDERYGIRLMLSDASVISAVDKKWDRSVLGYQQILGLLPNFRPRATQALLIGLGGGHVARDLKSQGLETDTIEIDPAVADAAQRFFSFKPTGRFLIGDARYEIKRLDRRYDIIIHDCFTGGTEPIHLLTQEMLGHLRELLTEEGLLALNYVGFRTGEGSEAVAAVYRTLKSLFPHVRTFTTDPTDFTDFVLLASGAPLDLERYRDDPRVSWLVQHEHHLQDTGGFIITDDYNPLERLQTRKAETYRKIFLERIAFDLLVR
ncbi:Spermine synthase [Candidatus Nitrospira inopinata]|jgi:spermidine synthase|uniref:Spermine synthase n=1 Tax=Candidatus Nitrospira inopinata TaxID=1715989 RepID=A0A0S4KUQ4_9BACT|nr:Spermine synthase [Candidatus Nitrospira inopinata]